MQLKSRHDLGLLEGIQVMMAFVLVSWTYRYAGLDSAAMISAIVVAAGLFITAFVRVSSRPKDHGVVLLGLAIAALLSPLLLGFADISGAKAAHAKVGLILAMAVGFLALAGEFDRQSGSGQRDIA